MEFLITGIVLGLSAGTSPGPLFALVVSESLRGTTADGIKVALSPLITDAPIILLCYFLLRQIQDLPLLLGVISCIGGVYVLYLGIQSLRVQPAAFKVSGRRRTAALWKGVVTNAASPHPYLFWISVGTPLMMRALETGALHIVLFLAGFYVCLVGAKTILAVVSGQSKRFLNESILVHVNRVMGVILIVFSLLLFYQAFRFFLQL
ncbi:MAG: LysE family translocator [candidate division KSB1 bacterium]|nr:LysE family translocator [candidate division KSB1 bacterium]